MVWKENNASPAAVETTGKRLNGYWKRYYAKNKEQIKQRLREQKTETIGQNITPFEVWDQGSKKLETSLDPIEHAVTLCEISTKIFFFFAT